MTIWEGFLLTTSLVMFLASLITLQGIFALPLALFALHYSE
jgi:hypothetical protein